MGKRAEKQKSLTDEERIAQIVAENEKAFWDGLAKLGIDFEMHKKAVAKAEWDVLYSKPILDSEEAVTEYYERPAEDILNLSSWDDEDIISAFGPLDRGTPLSELIDSMNDAAVDFYRMLAKTPEEQWDI